MCAILLELRIFQDYLDIDMAHQNLSLQSHLLHINAGYKTNSSFPLPSEALFSSFFSFMLQSHWQRANCPPNCSARQQKRTSHLPDRVFYAFLPCWFGFCSANVTKKVLPIILCLSVPVVMDHVE